MPVGLYSPASGLGWEKYLGERLDAELARSASFEQDLSLLLVEGDSLAASPGNYEAAAKATREFFSFRDLAFERGENGFVVILPNMDAEHAMRMAEEFLKKLDSLLRGGESAGAVGAMERQKVFIGLSSRSGRLVDSERLLIEAVGAVEKSREEGDTRIVAFRPDPDKYRLYLASKGCA
jgi:GGDEF domain-containing protein